MATESRCRINKSHPFLEYAFHGLVVHANGSQSLGVQQQGFIRDFPLAIWVRLHNLVVINPADRMSENVSLIFVIKNALALVELLIKQESELTSTQHNVKGERYQSSRRRLSPMVTTTWQPYCLSTALTLILS